MTEENQASSAEGVARERLNQFLEFLAQQGFKQAQIAARAEVPPQYISDIKRGRRPMTELVARRLGEGFDVNFQWLMGTSAQKENPQLRPASLETSNVLWLPLFSHPIEGDPFTHPKWNGARVEIVGAVAGKCAFSKHPYVFEFGHDDQEDRLQKGDLVLVSQMPSTGAQIHVVRHAKKSFLARADRDGSWRRVADGSLLPSKSLVTGHCVGIVWASLL